MTLLSTGDLRRLAKEDLMSRPGGPTDDPRTVVKLPMRDIDMEPVGLCLGTVFDRVAYAPTGEGMPFARTTSTVFVDAVTGEVVPVTVARDGDATTLRCSAFVPEDAGELVAVALAARADYVRVVPATGDARASIWLMVDEVVHLWRYVPEEFHARLVSNLESDRTGPNLAARSTETSGRLAHVRFDRAVDGRVDATLVLTQSERESVASEMARRLDALRGPDDGLVATAGEDLDREVDDAKLARLGTRLESRRRTAVALVPDGDATPERYGSYALGTPAWPAGAAWPTTLDGRPLFFLAQVACADLRPLPGFPDEGLLQFFVSDEDYGRDSHDVGTPSGHRVVWHPSLDYPTEARSRDRPPTGPLPFVLGRDAVALVARTTTMTEGTGEASFDRDNPGFEAGYGVERSAFLEEGEAGHYVGGWPRTVRGDLAFGTDDVVLARFASDSVLRWGHGGTAHFTIGAAALASRDFAAATFDWDE